MKLRVVLLFLAFLTFAQAHAPVQKERDRAPWHVPIGAGVLLIKEGHVLMLKRAYHDWGFGVIAGELAKGETLRHSVVRHTQKEVGVTIDEADLKFVCVVHYKTDNTKEAPLVFFFATTSWQGEPFNKEPERHSEMQWIDLHQPPALAPGEHLVLEAYNTGGVAESAYLESGW